MIIGRDLNADLRIPDPRISHAHLILRFDQGRWLAIDNGSLNGTYVNRERIDATPLSGGDEVQIGKFRLVYLTAAARVGAGAKT